ncbi:MAG: hypothetical protein O7G87_22030, partial [bacterium]|nr:hypothetical protein [bacterium]
DFGGDWCSSEFDDSGWESGRSPFGATAQVPVTTQVGTGTLYLRTVVDLDSVPEKPMFYVASSGECQIFVNGQLVRSLRVRAHSAPISETCTMLRPEEVSILKLGENVVSVVMLPSERASYLAVRVLCVVS